MKSSFDGILIFHSGKTMNRFSDPTWCPAGREQLHLLHIPRAGSPAKLSHQQPCATTQAREGGSFPGGPAKPAPQIPADNPRHLVQGAETFCWLANARTWTYTVFKENTSPRFTVYLHSRKCFAMDGGNSRALTRQALSCYTTTRHRDAPVMGTAQEPNYILQCQVCYYLWLHSSSSLLLHIPLTHHKHGKQSPGISLNRALSGGDKAIGPDSRLHESKRCQSLKVLWQKASSV